MASPDEVLQRWTEERPTYAAFAEHVAAHLKELAQEGDLAVTTSSRAKEIASYRSKLITKSYADPWADVTDKAGARAVVAGHDDVDRLVQQIRSSPALEVLAVEDKRAYDPPDKLAYSGVHVQVAMDYLGQQLQCEVQVRTIAQDAWSVVSHKLVYKAALDLPAKEQHAVYRLVALIELFDQEVSRVADVLPKLPGYEWHRLIEAAESQFEQIAHAPSNREVTISVLEAIGPVLPSGDDYVAQLRTYVADHRAQIEDAVGTYGPASGLASSWAYALFSQPEMLVLLERLAVEPYELLAAWDQSDLPNEWLRTIGTYSDADLSLLG